MTTTTTTALPLAPGPWALDPFHSSVGFSIRHLGVSKVRGRFTDFTAEVTVGADLASTSVNATIQLASIDTGNSDRDAHVRTDEFMDVAQRPTLAFRSTAIVESGDRWRLDGEVTIGEVTKPVSLDVELGGLEVHPGDGLQHAGFEASGEIRRSDFGIAPQVPAAMLGDVIKVLLDLQLVAPGD
jgi:polyisoprenoid-binding protein YceI